MAGSRVHVVRPGECLSSIALEHGIYDWKRLYDAPENKDLRRRRPNPNVLYPGDKVSIPDLPQRKETCATGSSHRFVARRAKHVLRMVVTDHRGAPAKNEPFKVHIESPPISKSGVTTDEGLIEVAVPPSVRKALVEILGTVLEIQPGMLDPVSHVRGIQARLNNLGFDAGNVDGVIGRKTRRAIHRFQLAHGLQPSGEIDDKTRRELLRVHDNDENCPDPEEEMQPAKAVAQDDGVDDEVERVTLSLRLAIDPNEASSIDDTFTLSSTDGSYYTILTIKDDQVPGDAFVDLTYDGLDPSLNYTLVIDLGADNVSYALFEDVPYVELAAGKT